MVPTFILHTVAPRERFLGHPCRTRILADSAFSRGSRCMYAKDNSSAFAPFLADSGGEEQDDGFLG